MEIKLPSFWNFRATLYLKADSIPAHPKVKPSSQHVPPSHVELHGSLDSTGGT